jgi:hypothetical protein
VTADRGNELAQELERLRHENVRLAGLPDAHGIAWRVTKPATTSAAAATATPLTTDDKVALFRRLFRGRTDVYPVRRESKAGKAGRVVKAHVSCGVLRGVLDQRESRVP